MKATAIQQRGAAIVELTAALPMLLLLLLGMSELGKAFVQYNTLNKLVRDGARYAAAEALLGTTGTVLLTSDIATATRNLVVYGNEVGTGNPRLPGLATTQISITDAGNRMVMVQAAYPYMPITGPVLETFGVGPETPLGFTLNASVVMRAL
jgi:Flp pilus assembly protein TadG